MKHLAVLLMQLPVPNNTASNVPLAAGYLKAYAQADRLLDTATIDILPRALADHAGDALLVDEIIARAPDVLGISLYTWNSERSLEIARRVRAHQPELLVIVGGPEVQRDNAWVVQHPAVDVAVLGEGEQTFTELLRLLIETSSYGGRQTRQAGYASARVSPDLLASLPGIVFRNVEGMPVFTPDRAAMSDISELPSPYLLGFLEPSDMLMVEVSRWCPYACSFCLYGRNMGPKLGNRYFPLERILAEIEWGRAHGATSVHFVEANLNLVPVFAPLMRALADLNADGALALYAELRGEHLTDDVVAALCRAGLRVAEVGLQTANPAALAAARRKTDLGKWAAGTRRLLRNGVEIYLDIILGLPADDASGVATTLDFIRREQLGSYDVFTLQMLPGTAVRAEASRYDISFQTRPPYYVLTTDRLSYSELRQLRHELKDSAGLDPDEVEGCPEPRTDALVRSPASAPGAYVDQLWLIDASTANWAAAQTQIGRLSTYVDVVARWSDAAPLANLLAQAIVSNPSTLFDCYILADLPPLPDELDTWREALPFDPGYLDRVAVYRRVSPEPPYARVSPRIRLVVPWAAQVDPHCYTGVAEIIWQVELAPDQEPPLAAWRAAGGRGVWVRGPVPPEAMARWAEALGGYIWQDAERWHGERSNT
jgi:radical SAM superfamily enzyme YgiQ (UPF0313 family)